MLPQESLQGFHSLCRQQLVSIVIPIIAVIVITSTVIIIIVVVVIIVCIICTGVGVVIVNVPQGKEHFFKIPQSLFFSYLLGKPVEGLTKSHRSVSFHRFRLFFTTDDTNIDFS